MSFASLFGKDVAQFRDAKHFLDDTRYTLKDHIVSLKNPVSGKTIETQWIYLDTPLVLDDGVVLIPPGMNTQDTLVCLGKLCGATTTSTASKSSKCYKETKLNCQFCGLVRYCSRECRKHDRKKHRPECIMFTSVSQSQ